MYLKMRELADNLGTNRYRDVLSHSLEAYIGI